MELYNSPLESTLYGLLIFSSLLSVSSFLQITRHHRYLIIEKILKSNTPPLLWKIFRLLANASSFEVFQFILTGAQQGVRVATILFCSYLQQQYLPSIYFPTHPILSLLLISTLISIPLIFIFDSLARFIAEKYPMTLFQISSFLTQISILLFFPAIIITLKISQWLSASKQLFVSLSPRDLLLHLIDEVDDSNNVTDADRRLIHAVINFKDRIAREIMRPRVSLFCLPDSMSLKAAASYMQKEGYSRVPVYKGTIDSIMGVLFYKDVLSTYLRLKESGQETRLEEPIGPLVKKIHYCPETKKISSLLQEFRKKQTHLAVVVDEYGGTSGLVTIEDILEELVGEIADEYDDVEMYSQKIDDHHWIVDARVTILDLEEETGIKIPQEGDYDTIAGYIFYKLGAIPIVGHVLHHDEYDMKIISCNDRMVEKVEIELHPKSEMK